MTLYSMEPRTSKYHKGHRLLQFARKYRKQLLHIRLDAIKTASKKSSPKSS